MISALEGQIAELASAYPQLTVVGRGQAETTIAGPLAFEAAPDDLEAISASFDIELTVPHTFPKRLPRATETGGRIRGADYEHVFTDGTLCLGVPIHLRAVFAEQPTLLGFVDRLLVPYLYGFCFWQKHGRHPFGEAAHGSEGILNHYLDLLGLDDPLAALRAIRLLCEHGYDPRQICPCDSGRRVRACHRDALRTLNNHHTPETLLADFQAIFEACHQRFQRGQLSFPRPMRRQLHRLLKRLERPTHHLGSVHAPR